MKHTSDFYHVKISNLKKYIQLQNIYINIQNKIKDVQKSLFCFRAKSKNYYKKNTMYIYSCWFSHGNFLWKNGENDC